jgi:hypothetical protein
MTSAAAPKFSAEDIEHRKKVLVRCFEAVDIVRLALVQNCELTLCRCRMQTVLPAAAACVARALLTPCAVFSGMIDRKELEAVSTAFNPHADVETGTLVAVRVIPALILIRCRVQNYFE